jgi:uncharacterized repeat protein (TIGR03803 family)
MNTIFLRLGLLLWVMMIPSLCLSATKTLPNALYAFTNGPDGSEPYAGLAPGSDGNFYGTCFEGGSNSLGSVFKITQGGALTPLYSFGFIDGSQPTAALVQGSDGNFYGTTFEGGTSIEFGAEYGYGTVFQISSNGAFNSLYSFTNGIDGGSPYAGLAEGLDGAYYGATVSGGASGDGVIFQITSAGALTPFYSFTNGVDGSQPRAAMILGGDGGFYGTTYQGGSNGLGVVFRFTTIGGLTPLHSFKGGSEGANPLGQLLQWTNGVLYGTTFTGGAGSFGTIFNMTTGGSFSTLYSFTNGIDGAYPGAGLALGSNGNFYGTTYSGGPYGYGGIFKITPQGALTPLYLFTGGNDGSFSYATLAQGHDGDFYGTTSEGGGSKNGGVVFKLNAYSTAPILTSITHSAGTIEFTWLGLPGQSYQAQYATNLTQTTWSNLGGLVTATNGTGSQTDSTPGNTQRFYRVYLP